MTNKKKIIISSYDDITNPYYHGGGAICIHEVAKGLRPLYNITVLTSKHVGSHRDEEKDGVFYKRIGHTPAFFPPIGQMIFTLLLPVYVRLLSFDIWIESFTPPFSTAFLPVFTKKPVMGLAHFLSGEEMRKRYKLPFDLIEKIGLRRYSRFIVPHMVTGKKILETVPDAQVRCIPNGVHLPKRRNTKTQKIVSFLGRIEIKQKGLDILIEAISKIKDDTGWSYVIAGSGISSEQKELGRLLKQYGLQDRVSVIGRVAGKDKKRFFEETAIFVVPSRFETFSLVALEALAYGLPIVAFEITGLSWLPRKGVSWVRPSDAHMLARKIQTLQHDSKSRISMSKINTQASKSYAWETVLTLYRSLIREII